jgi:Uma2 family endonuclease
VFSQYDVLQPDVVYFASDRAHLVDLDRVITDAPDLCVEVLSPSTREAASRKDVPPEQSWPQDADVRARYEVREYWIADPDARSIEIYRLLDDAYALAETANDDDIVSSPMLPGLAFVAPERFPSSAPSLIIRPAGG